MARDHEKDQIISQLDVLKERRKISKYSKLAEGFEG